MIKRFTLEEILALNPQIEKEDFEEAREILSKMRVGKMAKHRYSLVPPFARPRVTVGEGDNTDSRTIILRKTKQ